MRCSYCDLGALFKCDCHDPYMCQAHLAMHLLSKNEHKYEDLNIVYNELKQLELKSDILKAFQKLNKAQNEITAKVFNLIEHISNLHKKTTESLNMLTNKYYQILQQEIFCISDIAIVDQIDAIRMLIPAIQLDVIKTQIEKIFSQELVFENGQMFNIGIKAFEAERKKDGEKRKRQVEEERHRRQIEREKNKPAEEDRFKKPVQEERLKNQDEIERMKKITEEKNRNKQAQGDRKLEPRDFIQDKSKKYVGKIENMYLKARISYFYTLGVRPWTEIQHCYSCIKEILISSDGKYLFFYWISNVGCSNISIYSISTKNLLERWCTSKNLENWNNFASLRRWISDYPECILQSWNFELLNQLN